MDAHQATKDIIRIFHEVQYKYCDLDLHLASGGLPDVNGKSDVDISLFSENYADLDYIFEDELESVKHDDVKPRKIYKLSGYSREVNIYATNDQKLANRGVKHREN